MEAESHQVNRGDLYRVLNVSGEIILASKSHEQILGLKPHQLVGLSFLELIHPEDRVKAYQRLLRCFSQRQKTVGRCRFKKNGGSYVLMEVIRRPIIYDGKVKNVESWAVVYDKRKVDLKQLMQFAQSLE